MALRKHTYTKYQYICDCCGYPDSGYSCDPASPFHIGHDHFSVRKGYVFDLDKGFLIIEPKSIFDVDLCNICYNQALDYLKGHPGATFYDFVSHRWLIQHPHTNLRKESER